MTTSIGSRLKSLRLKKGLTQEQMAEAFGLSAQAVSRWENDCAYPDITLLPGLAIFLETTVDAIVGMDEIRTEEALREIHCEINRLVRSGDAEGAVALIRSALKRYPADSGLMMSLGETLAHCSADPAAAEEAVRIGEHILQSHDVSMKAKSTTCANLLFLCLRTGQMEKARSLVRSLPHLWESREILAAELEDGDAYAAALRESILKMLVLFTLKLDALPNRPFGRTPESIQLGVDFTPKASASEMLDRLRAFLEESQNV